MHLTIGLLLLATGAYFAARLAHNGKAWWQQTFGTAKVTGSIKPNGASDDPILSAANLQVYGVFGQKGQAVGGSDESAGSPPGSAPAPLADRSYTAEHRSYTVDHRSYTAEQAVPNHFLHRRVTVKTSQIFAFEIPAHAFCPELRGKFRLVATERSPGGGPGVEVLLLNEEEFANFINHRPWIPTLSLDPANSGVIRWSLNSPAVNPKKYYLMLRNTDEARGPSSVDADFTASFE